uniref:ABC transporter domain-containing protein n=1 Tax=Parascaris univalens TaxID=6257 RepID=A0A915BTL1_PARUN
LTGGENVTLDVDDLAMEPIAIGSKESSLIGRSRKQCVPFWDDERLFERAISSTTVVPQTRLSWFNVNVKVTEPDRHSKSLIRRCIQRTKKLTRIDKSSTTTRNLILKDVFGSAESSEVLAILGPSGSGKTTLLNVLTQRILTDLQVDGVVRINGQQLSASAMHHVCAYVQQDDLFSNSMTVREHLTFYAALRMGSDYSSNEKRKRVDDIIHDLGLNDCADSYVGEIGRLGGISGGERKRLAFACEILTNPPLLFCDEPTSGVDSFLAQQIVQVLRKLAHRKGMTIVVTAHQPSSQIFAMFDRIHLMTHGRVAFNGRPSEAIEMWNRIGYPLPRNYNPADHFMKTLGVGYDKDGRKSFDLINQICDCYENSDGGRKVLEEAKRDLISTTEPQDQIDFHHQCRKFQKHIQFRLKSSWSTQLRILIWRSFLTTIRDPVLLRVRLFQTIITGVITGLVYLRTPITQTTIMNINGLLFTFICSMNYLFQIVVVEVFCGELPIFLREHANGLYRCDAYFIAKNIAETPQYVVLPLIFTSILYWMAGFAMSCIFKELSIAVNIMPAFVMPAMAFAGFFINQNTLPIYFIYLRFLSYFRYAYESLIINEWAHVDYIPGCTNDTACLQTGTDVIDSLSFNTSHLYPDIVALLVMTLVIRLIAFVALYIRACRTK